MKTVYYLEIVTPETMKLLGSTTNKITKDDTSFRDYRSSIGALQYY